jgi:hypothetical protein
MVNRRSIVLCFAGLLASTVLCAEDEPVPPSDPASAGAKATELTPAAKAFISEFEHAARPPLSTLPLASYNDEFLRPFPEVDFVDSAFFSQVSELRRVSFITFAEVGEAQLFLGVNSEGFLGLHFNAFREPDSSPEIEMLRMPYLATEADEDAAE